MWDPHPVFFPSSPHVLLVEDQAATARGLALLLQNEGYAVEVARDAACALRLAASGVFDLLICDGVLPDGDGVSLIQRITRSTPMPAILISASLTSLTADVLSAGCVAGFPKPLDVERFLATVRQVVRSARSKPTSRMTKCPRSRHDSVW